MKAGGAIIAAGRGARLRAGADGVPKPLVEVGGEVLLARQARLMLEAGARPPVVAVVNSETATAIRTSGWALPRGLEVMERDTQNSMESLFAVGERLASGWFLLATVDAVVEQGEFNRFASAASKATGAAGDAQTDGVLAVTRWRGDQGPLFAQVGDEGLIRSLGGEEGAVVTAGLYFLPTTIFELAGAARVNGIRALRGFLAYLIERGFRLSAIEVAHAIDVDEPRDLEAARAAVRTHG
jgi:choline kinase